MLKQGVFFGFAFFFKDVIKKINPENLEGRAYSNEHKPLKDCVDSMERKIKFSQPSS